MTNQESILAFLTAVKTDLIQDQDQKQMIASGKSAESLIVSGNAFGGNVSGSSYWKYQIFGRGPGKWPPLQDIIDYLVVKRSFGLEQAAEIRSLAFLIARKIGTKGTDIFMHRRQGISFQDIINKALEILKGQLLKGTKADTMSAILAKGGKMVQASIIIFLLSSCGITIRINNQDVHHVKTSKPNWNTFIIYPSLASYSVSGVISNQIK
jgi:hypothetical protein